LEKAEIEKEKKGKKDEEISSEVKEMSEDIEKAITALKDEQKTKLTAFGKENKLAKQLVDLALLANGMLKGEDLDKFVKRSFELIK
ncbi:MAG: molecular chaperone HtpG, partial [Bacteroidia bacterium]